MSSEIRIHKDSPGRLLSDVLADLEAEGVPIERFTEIHHEPSGIIYVVTQVTPCTYEFLAFHGEEVGERITAREVPS